MDKDKSKASEIIEGMMKKDYFSQWMGIERMEEGEGFCTLKMTIREEMCNGFGIAHGGISYSLADSALAFASNSHGPQAVSLETSITHIRPLTAGDIIVASAKEIHLSRKIGHYDVRIEKGNGELVALFRGIVYIRSGK